MGVLTKYLQDFFQIQMQKTITKQFNLKIQNCNLISTRVNRPTVHLIFQKKLSFTHCSFFLLLK
jgi:hypothetical protein